MGILKRPRKWYRRKFTVAGEVEAAMEDMIAARDAAAAMNPFRVYTDLHAQHVAAHRAMLARMEAETQANRMSVRPGYRYVMYGESGFVWDGADHYAQPKTTVKKIQRNLPEWF